MAGENKTMIVYFNKIPTTFGYKLIFHIQYVKGGYKAIFYSYNRHHKKITKTIVRNDKIVLNEEI